MKTWRWMPGMKDTNGTIVTYVAGDGSVEGYNGQMVLMDDDCVPDWEDPATLGCLLYQVREARGEPWYSPTSLLLHGGERVWIIENPAYRLQKRYSSEAAVLLAALEEAKDV